MLPEFKLGNKVATELKIYGKGEWKVKNMVLMENDESDACDI
ncbi:hypothetical protein BTN50_0096 [Candidatus Enterovibrio altilux]|uniref:Uncharacterized protein n=1 Tax=Candidatus Enterovibrio altilux TaxID=1927128 RepID=A0A291B6L7_9GAMM|nr:hypothetical protein BTN50_0096 [Candidatus Enterovibrio luxaltus]